MGGDMASSFRDISNAPSTHMRGADRRDDDEVMLDGGPWW